MPICLRIRRAVFIEEQHVSEAEEVDGLDGACVHVLASDGDTDVGTARLRAIGGAAKVERVAVLSSHRGRGIGAAIMQSLEAIARATCSTVTLSAQVQVIPFYEGLGYVAEGPTFLDANIPHRKMTKALAR